MKQKNHELISGLIIIEAEKDCQKGQLIKKFRDLVHDGKKLHISKYS